MNRARSLTSQRSSKSESANTRPLNHRDWDRSACSSTHVYITEIQRSTSVYTARHSSMANGLGRYVTASLSTEFTNAKLADEEWVANWMQKLLTLLVSHAMTSMIILTVDRYCSAVCMFSATPRSEIPNPAGPKIIVTLADDLSSMAALTCINF